MSVWGLGWLTGNVSVWSRLTDKNMAGLETTTSPLANG